MLKQLKPRTIFFFENKGFTSMLIHKLIFDSKYIIKRCEFKLVNLYLKYKDKQ